MSTRYDVMFVKERKDNQGATRTDWYKCGIAFMNDKGTITLNLAMLPSAPNNGDEYRFVLQEPRPKQEGGYQQRQPARGYANISDDDIPF